MRTELPEYWCVKNEPNHPEIGKYFEQVTGRKGTYTNMNINEYIHNRYSHDQKLIERGKSGNLASYKPRPLYEVLSFEEFQTLVLNQPKPDPIYEIY